MAHDQAEFPFLLDPLHKWSLFHNYVGRLRRSLDVIMPRFLDDDLDIPQLPPFGFPVALPTFSTRWDTGFESYQFNRMASERTRLECRRRLQDMLSTLVALKPPFTRSHLCQSCLCLQKNHEKLETPNRASSRSLAYHNENSSSSRALGRDLRSLFFFGVFVGSVGSGVRCSRCAGYDGCCLHWSCFKGLVFGKAVPTLHFGQTILMLGPGKSASEPADFRVSGQLLASECEYG
jgi:hypothetical protein